MTLDVRPARGDELLDVLRLLRQMNPEDQAPGTAAAVEKWRRIRAQAGRCVLVAVVDDAVVGTADCIVIENLTRGTRPYMLIENVVVDAARRRSGVGTALMRSAIERAADADCYKVQLLADDTPVNHGFYGSCGLRPDAQGFKQRLDSSLRA